MLKRSVFLSLAAGLLAGLAFATPSQAGTIDTTVTFALTGGTTPTATDVDVFYTLTPSSASISDLTIVSSGGLTGTAIGPGSSPDEVTVTFNPAATVSTTNPLVFSFETSASSVGLSSNSGLSGVVGGPSSDGLNIAVTAVPEPTSLVLLGIGLSGLFTLRRFFKRTSVAC